MDVWPIWKFNPTKDMKWMKKERSPQLKNHNPTYASPKFCSLLFAASPFIVGPQVTIWITKDVPKV